MGIASRMQQSPERTDDQAENDESNDLSDSHADVIPRCRLGETFDYTALTPARSRSIESFASPKSIAVFGL